MAMAFRANATSTSTVDPPAPPPEFIMPRLLVLYASNSAVCGVGTWLDMLSTSLSDRGWDVTVGLAWGRTFHRPVDVEQARPGLTTIRMDGRGGTSHDRIRAVRKAIRQVNPDIVLVTLLDDGLAAVQLEKAAGRRLRAGVALHGNAPNHLAACLEHASALDFVTCVNRSCEQALRSLCGDPLQDRLHRLPNAVPQPFNVADRHSPVAGPLTIGFVGRLHDDKRVCDLDPFVAALRQQIPFRLIVAGAGPGESMVRAMQAADPERIEYLGNVTQHDLYQNVYPRLQALVSFSPSEGWPMGIAEAMAHGVVPVCSEFSGIHSEGVLRHEETALIFPVGEPVLAADHVARLARDADLRSRLATNAAREMDVEYRIDQFGDRWDQLLRQVLSQPPRCTPAASLKESPPELWSGIMRWVRGWRPGRGFYDTARGEWPPLQTRDESLRRAVVAALQAAHESAIPQDLALSVTSELTPE
jgi:glycosyltransferase involved in cell wall biosynthesis